MRSDGEVERQRPLRERSEGHGETEGSVIGETEGSVVERSDDRTERSEGGVPRAQREAEGVV